MNWWRILHKTLNQKQIYIIPRKYCIWSWIPTPKYHYPNSIMKLLDLISARTDPFKPHFLISLEPHRFNSQACQRDLLLQRLWQALLRWPDSPRSALSSNRSRATRFWMRLVQRLLRRWVWSLRTHEPGAALGWEYAWVYYLSVPRCGGGGRCAIWSWGA